MFFTHFFKQKYSRKSLDFRHYKSAIIPVPPIKNRQTCHLNIYPSKGSATSLFSMPWQERFQAWFSHYGLFVALFGVNFWKSMRLIYQPIPLIQQMLWLVISFPSPPSSWKITMVKELEWWALIAICWKTSSNHEVYIWIFPFHFPALPSVSI